VLVVVALAVVAYWVDQYLAWRRARNRVGFPKKFWTQRTFVSEASDLVLLPPEQIANFFRTNPEVARALLNESYDKRYTPSTFIEERGNGFRVGWVPRKEPGLQCVSEFDNLADAATDYLLFSKAIGRWRWPQ
jgi:hypothetical protein